jgi:hypothetical protein
MPGVDENDEIVPLKARAGAAPEDLLSRIKDRNLRDLIYLINKPPRWNEQVRELRLLNMRPPLVHVTGKLLCAAGWSIRTKL